MALPVVFPATMKREKRLTKKEKKALTGAPAPAGNPPHIHCVACGRHIDPPEFTGGKANWVRCAHGTKYAACRRCVPEAMKRLHEHDQSGKPVRVAEVWH